jgi:ABC-type multidrug transport system fused ATPase/permease subunit
MDNIKSAINFKFTDFLSLFGRGFGCFVFAFAIAWKFSVVFLALIPLMILSLFLMIRIIKKYTIEEFKAYGKAGSVAQEILSSIRTVISFGIQKKAIDSYETNLQEAEITGIKKGLYKGIFEGLYMGLYYCCFGIGIV